jgi:hypothetical protein
LALYGFGTAYDMTRDSRYLQAAHLCADSYIEQTSFDDDAPYGLGVPPNYRSNRTAAEETRRGAQGDGGSIWRVDGVHP